MSPLILLYFKVGRFRVRLGSGLWLGLGLVEAVTLNEVIRRGHWSERLPTC